MVLKKFKFCKVAHYFKSHCGPDRKQERNGVDLSKMTVTDEIKNEFAGIFLDHQKWIMDWENFLRKWWLFMFTFENYKMGGVGFRSPPPEISINWHKKIMRNSSIIFSVVYYTYVFCAVYSTTFFRRKCFLNFSLLNNNAYHVHISPFSFGYFCTWFSILSKYVIW